MKAKADDNELKVFISTRESVCSECGEEMGSHAWITLAGEKGALCLSCADMDHLVFLPSGSAALTLRAKKNSQLHAVVLKWSRTRKRYERQGLLVEEQALDKAEAECLADEEVREKRKAREAEKRRVIDLEYVKEYGKHIRQRYPGMPKGLEVEIAEHACRKYSGRVGRSERARKFDRETITLAVIAHIRHTETKYDELMMKGCDRQEARAMVRGKIETILDEWEGVWQLR